MNLYIVQMWKVIALNKLANKLPIYMISQGKYLQYQWQIGGFAAEQQRLSDYFEHIVYQLSFTHSKLIIWLFVFASIKIHLRFQLKRNQYTHIDTLLN